MIKILIINFWIINLIIEYIDIKKIIKNYLKIKL